MLKCMLICEYVCLHHTQNENGFFSKREEKYKSDLEKRRERTRESRKVESITRQEARFL